MFTIKTDILYLSNNFFKNYTAYSLLAEMGFYGGNCIQMSGQYHYDFDENTFGWNIIPEYKHFFRWGNRFRGSYSTFYSKFGNGNEFNSYLTNTNSTVYTVNTYDYYALGSCLGYQSYILDHFTIDFLFGLGLSYHHSHFKYPLNAANSNIYTRKSKANGDFRLSVNLGYKF